MQKKIPISNSVFSAEFEDTDSSEIFLLAKESALSIWHKYIDKKAASYFSLPQDNWIVKSSPVLIVRWLESYNSSDGQEVKAELDCSIMWNDNDCIWFCISKYLVIEAKWSTFKALWKSFLASEDDCPIIINSHNPTCAIIFSAMGDVSKFEENS